MPAISVESLIEYKLSTLVTSNNHSIFEDKRHTGDANFSLIPHCIYYYHIEVLSGGQPKITRYYWDNGNTAIDYEVVEGFITKLAKNHRSGGTLLNLKPDGYGMEGRPWERKSYIALVMDSQYWSFVRFGPNDQTAIACVPSGNYSENHTFLDGSNMNVDMDGNGTEFRSAVYFVNHMKKNDVEDITYKADGVTRDSQDFKFTFYYWIQRFGGGYDWHEHDPGGTNLGPPSAPPP